MSGETRSTSRASATSSRPRRSPARLPVGRNSPQRAPLRPLRRAAERHRVHRAARREPAHLALSHPAVRDAPAVRSASATAACARPRSTRSRRRRTSCAGIRCRCRRTPTDFVDGLATIAGNGDAAAQHGVAVHLYAANRSMVDRVFYDADGELLIVPQHGAPALRHRARHASTSRRGEIVVIPRGVRVPRRARSSAQRRAATSARTTAPPSPAGPRPDRLQRPRQSARLPDARSPPTRTRRRRTSWSPSSRATSGRREFDHSPLDVVAWHGNYAPYKYDLRRFNTIGIGQLRPPGPVDLHGADLASETPGGPTSTSSSSRRAGWSPSTRSARRGSTATS